MFEGILPTGSNDNPIEVLKSLLDKENIETKTELSMKQIKVLCKLKWHTELNKEANKNKDPEEIFEEVIEYYLQLLVSKNRKSREEIIKGISEMKEQLLQQGLMLTEAMKK